MQHAFIVTVPDLDLVKDEVYHLILPHLYRVYPEYLSFYKEQHKKGAWVIQDNSTFELKDNVFDDILMQGVREKFINEIIVPERLRNYKESVKLKDKFLSLWEKEIRKANIQVGAVLQGICYRDIEYHFLHLLRDSRIATIFMPFNFEFDFSGNFVAGTDIYEKGYNRFVLLICLVRAALFIGLELKPIHLLGLFNPIELRLYTKRGRKEYFKVFGKSTDYISNLLYKEKELRQVFDNSIRGNDSSSCYWHANFGVKYSKLYGLLYQKIKSHVNFGVGYKYYEQYKLFRYNKNILKEFCL